MEGSYWTQRQRLGRRSFIRGAGLLAGAMTVLPAIAACGGNAGSKSGGTTGSSGGTTGGTEARKASAPGVTPDTITIGSTQALSGPAASYGQIGQAMAAYFARVNDEGGVNGRKIKFLMEDDAYSPANTPPLAKKLVEQDHILYMATSLGTAPNSAIVDYLNDQKVPQLFVASGAGKWGDYKKYPWTIGGIQTDYPSEGRIYGKYVAQTWSGKKVGLLYQNDDFGKDYLTCKETLGKDNPVVDEETFETTASDLSQQMTNLKGKGAEVLIMIGIPKLMGLALKFAGDQGWRPNIVLTSTAADPSIFQLAGGPQNVEGVISDAYYKQYDTPDPGIQQAKDLFAKYAPNLQLNLYSLTGFADGLVHTEVMKRAGVNPTRESILAAAESFDKFAIPVLLDGLTISTSKTNHSPLRAAKMLRAEGGRFNVFGDIVSAS